jgi:hypothetical protein
MEKKDLQVINYNIYIKLSNAIYICIFIGKKKKKTTLKQQWRLK